MANVEVIGLKQANRALKQLPEFARVDVQQVMDVTAFQVSRSAASKAPTSTDGSHGRAPGFLRSSIEWASRPRSLSAVVGIALEAFYWKFVEYGTRKMGAKPFMRPAADEARADHDRRMIGALARAANQVERAAK